MDAKRVYVFSKGIGQMSQFCQPNLPRGVDIERHRFAIKRISPGTPEEWHDFVRSVSLWKFLAKWSGSDC
jgi:hypothetical protein